MDLALLMQIILIAGSWGIQGGGSMIFGFLHILTNHVAYPKVDRRWRYFVLTASSPFVRRVDNMIEACFGKNASYVGLRRLALGATGFGIAFLTDHFVYPSLERTKNATGNFLAAAWIAAATLIYHFSSYLVFPAIIRAGTNRGGGGVNYPSTTIVLPSSNPSSLPGPDLQTPTTIGVTVLPRPDYSSILKLQRPTSPGDEITAGDTSCRSPMMPSAAAAAAAEEEGVTTVGHTTTCTCSTSSRSDETFIEFDSEVCRVGILWCALDYFIRFIGVLLGGAAGGDQAIILTYIIGFACLMRPTALRWSHQEGTYFMHVMVVRVILPGLPVANVPVILMPALVKHFTAPVVVFVYPLVVALVEYFFISHLLHDKVVQRFSDQQFSVIARLLAAALETSRVGIIVIVSNASKDFSGLVRVTILNSVLFPLASNGVIKILGKWVASTLANFELRLPQPPTPYGRFKRVYHSCKPETLLWTGYILVLIKVSGFGHYNAIDEETGELVPELVCEWAVIAVVVLGQVFGILMSYGLRAGVRKWAPAYSVDVPAPSIQPSNSAVVHVVMWIQAGAVVFYGYTGLAEIVK